MTTCTGHHYQRDLPSEGDSVRLILCSGCDEATLVIGIRAVGVYDSPKEAEQAYINMINEGVGL
ncbi:MAG: hypothetical protein ACO3VQ_02470 [Ilumatobacteraceae bacterium]